MIESILASAMVPGKSTAKERKSGKEGKDTSSKGSQVGKHRSGKSKSSQSSQESQQGTSTKSTLASKAPPDLSIAVSPADLLPSRDEALRDTRLALEAVLETYGKPVEEGGRGLAPFVQVMALRGTSGSPGPSKEPSPKFTASKTM